MGKQLRQFIISCNIKLLTNWEKKMIKDKKILIILILLIILTSFVKLNPLTTSAQMYSSIIELRGDYINIRPLETIKEYVFNANRYNKNIIFNFFLANSMLYLPIALFLGIKKFKKSKSIALLILLPFILDIIQLALKIGVFDIDAVILSIFSSIIAFLISMHLSKKYL